MSVKTLKIDGIDVAIESGSTILQAAQAAGIEIPTLCYLKGVSAVGACRLCMVEIAGAHVWDVAYRGADCQIISGLNQPWGEVSACTSCGKCVDACPTGAIFRKSETSGERVRDPEKLEFLVNAREKHEWTR